MDLDSDSEKKLNALKQRIIVIMTKNKKTSLPLGTVLHNADKAKLEIKKAFSQYRISKDERKNEKDDFNWVRFFDENLCPEFEVETNYHWDDGKISDALHYHPQNEANQIGNIAIIQSSQKDDVLNQEQILQIDVKPIENDDVKNKPAVINEEETKPEIKMTQEEINKLLHNLLDELNIGLYEKERSIRLTLLAVLAGESTRTRNRKKMLNLKVQNNLRRKKSTLIKYVK